ncbi:OLC1v1027707C1 [Oldenlandia corymbosa var. corymbosa]|uniref:OLC1v1027707C1 n=2 Tax=Oldenlandia corymbosa var. corymbosa TaxID=529605 RepID=A0AAV1CAV3_OLDCO|nr:OLC1v1027707C1 [Oldenlandia corymbosa var. corymbosa]
MQMESRKFEPRLLLKDKRFWIASFLIVWAAGLQGHMMCLQRQDAFKQKFGTVENENEVADSD